MLPVDAYRSHGQAKHLDSGPPRLGTSTELQYSVGMIRKEEMPSIAEGLPFRALMASSHVLDRSFYARPAVDVAKDCLGKILVHGRVAGRIVETEAYLGVDDMAAHASRGITNRTRLLFGPPGHAYVYFIYGMYDCLNFVAEEEGKAGCVLIRALEPATGIPIMRRGRPAAKRL